MKINIEICTGCELCIETCPSEAISLRDGVAVIDEELCTECGTCTQVECCPVDAITESPIWGTQREVRALFSRPSLIHYKTSVPGRGTEEVKTNDVTGRVKQNQIGFVIEVGRPCLGTRVSEIEKITIPLSKLGIHYEPKNPLVSILESIHTGKVKPELRGERLSSAIIEFTTASDRLKEVLTLLQELSEKIDTVFSLGIILCFDEQGEIPILDTVLPDLNLTARPNAKVNIGLGRPLIRG